MSYLSKHALENIYDISENGFLPQKCYTYLPASFQNNEMIELFDNLSEKNCIKNKGKFRELVKSMNKYSYDISSIKSLSQVEKKFLYSFLSMVVHRYLWCDGVNGLEEINGCIPNIIGLLWVNVSNELGIVPVLTHASVDLFNWIEKNASDKVTLDNIDVIMSMTGDISEHWFYKVMIAIEGEGGHILNRLPKISEIVTNNNLNDNKNEMMSFLTYTKNSLGVMNTYMKRMYENCDASFFFNNLRIYLSGSKHDKFPEGVKVEGTDIVLKYNGGSAAQSSLIQIFDALFEITHVDHTKQFLQNQRDYMPNQHRKFIEYVEGNLRLRSIIKETNDNEMINEFNACVKMLARFRRSHLGIVNHYIMKFVGQSDAHNNEVNDDNDDVVVDDINMLKLSTEINDIDQNKHVQGAKGTGGTDPVSFCKEVIHDTEVNMIKL
jgi:hypothetical protein